MAIDRSLWTCSFEKGYVPTWRCPYCKSGTLHPVFKKGQILMLEGWASGDETEEHPSKDAVFRAGLPGQQVGVFTCLLACDNKLCKAFPITLSGDINLKVDEDDEYGMLTLYTPSFFNPPLHIFPIPSRCPAAIAKELSNAFRLYWCDPASCVNHQRIAIELLLDKMKVRRFSVKNGKRSRITLHHRIENLPEETESQREIKESLLAIKFIGNEGSHAGYISKEDALDGFELLEQLVDEEARERQREMRKRRKQIIKQKGPRGKAEAVRHSRLMNKLRKKLPGAKHPDSQADF